MRIHTQSPHIFNFHDHDIRVCEDEGQPWFVAADVLNIFGVQKNNRANWLMKLRRADKDKKRFHTPGGPQPMTVISESGLYTLLMRSDKSVAKDFQEWVTADVLPAVRKDGAYVLDEEKVASGEMSEDEFVMKAMQILSRKVERITAERDAALVKVAEQAPKVADYEARWSRHDTIGLTQFAEQSGLRKNKFTEALREMDYLFNRGSSRNIPYAKHMDELFVRRDTAQGFPQTFITKQGAEHFQGLIAQGTFDHIRTTNA
ncbi:Prophage antirepressor [Aliiroseovarius halocynthiae]|uniref:Bro-N domain-containing protein n=1 Tax=Aliiroseovarius halocynthiae TaxID=985055 RepID=A0A545SR73_9RHOB|nr:BRO family protein [Aliiroseovarius halocynthiae]TQV67485.1 hypothetical protein FIL88_09680 [Aliiroseovarius halocynthiae]SMR81493.1 Prophage antirepressor [Aliiroseovarius halocynthiae]